MSEAFIDLNPDGTLPTPSNNHNTKQTVEVNVDKPAGSTNTSIALVIVVVLSVLVCLSSAFACMYSYMVIKEDVVSIKRLIERNYESHRKALQRASKHLGSEER